MQLDAFLSSFAQLTRDMVMVVYSPAVGAEGKLVWANEAAGQQLKMTTEEMEGQSISSFFESGSFQDMIARVRPEEIVGRAAADCEVICLRSDGSTFWGIMQLIFLPRDESGGRLSAGIIRDISTLKERESAAATALEERRAMAERAEALWSRLVLAIDALDAPMAIWDKDRRLVLCNKAFGPRLMGHDLPTEPNITHMEFLRTAAYSGQFPAAVGKEEAWIATAATGLMNGDVNDLQTYADGRTFLSKTERSANGDMVIHNYEMTEAIAREKELNRKNKALKKAERNARRQALRDELTGLGNRRFVAECLKRFAGRKRKDDRQIAVLQIDLDRFKQINDTLGHAAGDHVLLCVAKRLSEITGSNEQIGRIGGDEFVVISTGPGIDTRVRQLGNAIATALSAAVEYRGSSLRVGGSVGIAMTPVSAVDDLLVHADVALYRAKAEGRGKVRVFDHEDLETLRRTRKRGDEILLGLDQGQFVPWYQVQVDAQTNLPVGLEVLARWEHPKLGVLPPDAFLQQADDLNVLGELDRQVFEQAIAECSAVIPEQAVWDLSVNVSEERLMASDISAFLDHAARYPGHVAVELLESIFMDDGNEAFQFQIDRLKEAGIGIQLDDFGSGRASIVALEQVAPDRLKIDRRLVASAATSKKSARLLRSIIEIGQTLEIAVTAEGVETAAQAKVLGELGCHRLQGFYFGRPMSIAQIQATHFSKESPANTARHA